MNREEKIFYDYYNRNKTTCCIRFEDNSDINGMNKGKNFRITTGTQPADFIVVDSGRSFFAEVKGTTQSKYSPSLIRKSQLVAAKKVAAAGGEYLFFVFSHFTQQWYTLPLSVAQHSAEWSELNQYINPNLEK